MIFYTMSSPVEVYRLYLSLKSFAWSPQKNENENQNNKLTNLRDRLQLSFSFKLLGPNESNLFDEQIK